VSFKYDPFGRRIYKSSSSGTSTYAYDGDNLIDETNSSGAAVARYSQTLNIDEPLAMLRSATTSYYQADGLGSVTSLSNGAGALAQTYTFDSFGKQTASSGSLTNPFQYTAREFDTETNLYFYRARYMDTATGRFLSEDPIEFSGGNEFYVYALNRAVNFVDPSGLDGHTWGPITWYTNEQGMTPTEIKAEQPMRPSTGAISGTEMYSSSRVNFLSPAGSPLRFRYWDRGSTT
jgi:RHS repeat-associated protein